MSDGFINTNLEITPISKVPNLPVGVINQPIKNLFGALLSGFPEDNNVFMDIGKEILKFQTQQQAIIDSSRTQYGNNLDLKG